MTTADMAMRMDPIYGEFQKDSMKIQTNLQMHLEELGLN